MNAFTWTFLAALAASIATRLWLAQRQVAHVRAHRAAVPATFADSIPLEAHQKAADYTVAKSRVGMVDMLVGAAALLALTLGGGIEWLSTQWSRVFEAGGLAHGTALIASVVIVTSIVDLPFAIYRTFVVEQRFGFNRMTWRLFLADLAKHALVEALIGLPLLVLVLWLMAQMGERWWLWVWAVWVGFSLVFLLAYPRWIMPLFNKFSPVTDADLAARIERLLARCGFRSSGLSIMDGSKRSAHGNAFFIGLGATKRIVLFDTLVERLKPEEVEAVLAHELGHFKLKHITKMLVINMASSLALLWVLGRLIGEPWFYSGLGVATPSTAAALVLFFFVLPVFVFFFSPLLSMLSRKHEFEADAYAAEYADKRDLSNALVKLYKDNAATLTPDPLHSAFYDSHPPASTRIARLRTA